MARLQYYVIKFVSDLRQVVGFSGFLVSSTSKTDCHKIAKILLKVVLNTIAPSDHDISKDIHIQKNVHRITAF